MINIVQRPFNWAVGEERAEKNPFKGVTHGRGSPRRPMTPGEFPAVVRATRTRHSRKRPTSGARFRTFLDFLWYTGARPGEAGKLRWSDIDLDGAVIVLREHKTARTQRVKVPRIIPLDPFLVQLPVKVRKQGDPGELVFLTHCKTPWNRSNLSLRVQRGGESAGVPEDAKLYGIRHGFGTRSILNGVDLKILSQLMGHTTTRMTEHYVHLAGQGAHLAAAMRRANGRHPGS